MKRKIAEPTTQRMPQEDRRVVLKWATKGDEIVGYKKIEIVDVYLDRPLPDADDRDITSKLRSQLPHLPQQATREAFADGQQTGGIHRHPV